MEIVVVSEEKPQKGIIRLQKADKEAEQEKKSPYASLKGAEYTLSSKEDVYKRQDQAYATAVVLLVLVVGINCLSGYIAKKITKGNGNGEN